VLTGCLLSQAYRLAGQFTPTVHLRARLTTRLRMQVSGGPSLGGSTVPLRIQYSHSVYLYVCLSHCRTTRSAIGCQVPTTLLRPNACAYGIATTLLPVPQVSIGQYSRYGFNTMEHLDGPQAYLQLPAFCPAIALPCSRKTLLQGQTDQKTAVGVSNRVH
jgi:hypothetical protein